MSLLDPIPSPVEHADFAALEWEPLLALVAGFQPRPWAGTAILSIFKPSTDEEPGSRASTNSQANFDCCSRNRFPFPSAASSTPRSTGRQGADSRRGPRSQ
jgi:hypothetical protein